MSTADFFLLLAAIYLAPTASKTTAIFLGLSLTIIAIVFFIAGVR